MLLESALLAEAAELLNDADIREPNTTATRVGAVQGDLLDELAERPHALSHRESTDSCGRGGRSPARASVRVATAGTIGWNAMCGVTVHVQPPRFPAKPGGWRKISVVKKKQCDGVAG